MLSSSYAGTAIYKARTACASTHQRGGLNSRTLSKRRDFGWARLTVPCARRRARVNYSICSYIRRFLRCTPLFMAYAPSNLCPCSHFLSGAHHSIMHHSLSLTRIYGIFSGVNDIFAPQNSGIDKMAFGTRTIHNRVLPGHSKNIHRTYCRFV